MRSTTGIQTRPYIDADEREVLDLLTVSLGAGPAGRRPPEFFRWKHLENPFGRSLMLVAEADERIVGLRAFMRWGFAAGDRRYTAVRAVDTATHPDYQGKGIFSQLTTEALDLLRAEGTHLVFNTPNGKSLPGYLKMGWQVVGSLPIHVRVRRPIRFGGRVRSLRGDADPQGGAEEDPRGTLARALAAGDGLVSAASLRGDERLHTELSTDFLRWRYLGAPALGYRARMVGDPDRPDGIAIYRVRPRGDLREATVADVLVRTGDRRTATKLLRSLGADESVDHVTASFPSGTRAASALLPSGYIRTPTGITLTSNVLTPGVSPDPLLMPSWALRLGDVEVF